MAKNPSVDEHIAAGNMALDWSENSTMRAEMRQVYAVQATAHFAAASALLARYPGWGDTGVQKKDYRGIDDIDTRGRSI